MRYHLRASIIGSTGEQILCLLRVRVHKTHDNDIDCDDVFVIRDSSGSMASISGAQ